MPDRIRLDGRVAVVTGAAGVIGSATIKLLAERGARIVAVDRREADLKTAIKALPASAEAIAVEADVTQEGDVAEYVHAASHSPRPTTRKRCRNCRAAGCCRPPIARRRGRAHHRRDRSSRSRWRHRPVPPSFPKIPSPA